MKWTRMALALWLLSALAALAAGPRVVKITPDDGQVGVDPETTEIRVEFDQDMGPGFSFAGGGPLFPKCERPRWLNPRVCVLPVTLEPDHVYQFSVNSPNHTNFQNRHGEPARAYPVIFMTGPSRTYAAGPALNQTAFDELRRAVDERYSYRDLHGLDWGALFAARRRALVAAPSAFAFAREAAALLEPAKDLHIWLIVGDADYSSYSRSVQPNMNFQAFKGRLADLTSHHRRVVSGRFDGGVGYLFIGVWIEETAQAALAALAAMADLDKLIIDVRANGGGDESQAARVAGLFLDKPRVYARHVTRDPGLPNGFSKPVDRVVDPAEAARRFAGKVAVLTGPKCMSSNEAFLLMMKQAPNAVLIGARSFGSSGNPQEHKLANGVSVFLPSWQAMRPDGTVFEGSGIAPDMTVSPPRSAFADADPVLEKALGFLRN